MGRSTKQQGKTSRAVARTKPVRVTVLVSPELADAVRDAVVALSGPPERMTLARFATEAFTRELARLSRKYNGGQPFPKRRGAVRTGRPLGG